jgi:hypothetical protein
MVRAFSVWLLGSMLVMDMLLSGCPSPSPQPSPPVADGAAPPPPAPSSACAAACAHVKTLGCPVGGEQGCAESFDSWDHGAAHIRRKDNGMALTCADVNAATSAAQLEAMGFSCK